MKITRILPLLTLTALTTTALAETWPQWRGPARDGIDRTATPWPDKLTDHLTLKWEVPLDDGYSGPIVSEDTVFTVETLDKKFEVVRAFHRADGTPKWEHQWEGKMSVPFFARSNGSWVRSTPTFDGESLFVGGMRDVLVCLDAQTGKPRWTVDFTERYNTPVPSFGFVCSPLVIGDDLYVQAGASFLKLNKHTGEEIWRTMNDGGGMWGSVFSSPSQATLHGEDQLLVQSRTTLAGIRASDGTIIWQQKVEAFRGMNILTPMLYGDNQVMVNPYGEKSKMYSVSKEAEVTEAWSNKLQGYMSSPLIMDGHAYLHLRNQRFVCINLSNGDIKWTSPRGFGKYMSLIGKDDKILALDEKGSLYLFAASPEAFEQIDVYEVTDQPAWAHLAIADDELYVRHQQGLKVFSWKAVASEEVK